jgi:uncharacterized protein (TIGR02246 family)
MTSDKDQIMALHNAWMDAEQRGDVDAMLSLCSSDIRLIPPDLPILQGKQAIREFLQAPQESINRINISNIHVEIGGTLALKTASFVSEFRGISNSQVKTIQGSHLWVLRREDSEWRIIIVAWSQC